MRETHVPDDLPRDPTLSYKRRAVDSGSPGDAASAEEMPTWGLLLAPAPAAGAPPPADTPDQAYRLLRRVATGGMGEVWEAEQASLGRVVAIKLIRGDRLGQDLAAGERVAEEFRREAVFAARLEHPNIVPVHDLGRDSIGNPLLAMKYVQGTPWSRELVFDLPVLPPPAFLAKHIPVLVSVAQAVAFAHSKGVVHRDLKPAQVMLGEFGEVLLIDWGLAVFVGEPDPPGRLKTPGLPSLVGPAHASNPSGTPALMAPEQTLDSASGVGTWTDVYLLGGTLYYLLTGTYPHDGETSQESFRLAMEGKIVPPSVRCPHRGMPRQLEELCLSALQSRPEDRCASVRDFIRGLQDHLSGEGRRRESQSLSDTVRVELGSGSPDYARYARCGASLEQAAVLWPGNPAVPGLREEVFSGHARMALDHGDLVLARLQAERLEQGTLRSDLLDAVAGRERAVLHRARTRRLAIATTFVLLALTVAGGALFTRQLSRSRDAEAALRSTAEKQRDLAREARARSDEFAAFVLNDMTARLATLNRLEILDPAVERALDYYRSVPFGQLPPSEWLNAARGLYRVMGTARMRGNSSLEEQAGKALERVLQDLPPGQASLPEWLALRVALRREETQYHIHGGDLEQALSTVQESEELARKRLAATPDSPDAYDDLGVALRQQAYICQLREENEEALALAEAAVRLDDEEIARWGYARTPLGRLTQSLEQLQATKTKLRDIDGAHAASERLQEVSQALQAFANEDNEDSSTAAGALVASASWLLSYADSREALAVAREAADLLRRIDADKPGYVNTQASLLNALGIASSAEQRLGNRPGALVASREAREVAGRLHQRDPRNVEWTLMLLTMMNNEVVLLQEAGDLAGAGTLCQEQATLASELGRQAPDRVATTRCYGLALSRRSSLLLSQGRPEDALPVAREQVAYADGLARRFPGEVSVMNDRISARSRVAAALTALDRGPEACVALEENAALVLEFANANPGNRELWERVGGSWASYSALLLRQGDVTAARAAARQSVTAYRRLLQLDPSRKVALAPLARSLQQEGELSRLLADPAAARTASTEALHTVDRALAIAPGSGRLHLISANAAESLARVETAAGNEAAIPGLLDRIQGDLDVLDAPPTSPDAAPTTEVLLLRARLAVLQSMLGNNDEAIRQATLVEQPGALAPFGSISREHLLGQAAMTRAEALLARGDAVHALDAATSATQHLAEASSRDPGNTPFAREHATSMVTTGRCLSALGDDASARASIQAAIERLDGLVTTSGPDPFLDDGLRIAFDALADIEVTCGDPGKASLSLARAADLAPGPGRDSLRIRGRLARALVRVGDLAEAQAVLRRLEGAGPASAETPGAAYLCRDYWAALAETREAMGDGEGARDAWTTLLRAFEPRPSRSFTVEDRSLQGVALQRLGHADGVRAIRDELLRTGRRDLELLLQPAP